MFKQLHNLLILALFLVVSFQDTYRLFAAETLKNEENLDSYFEEIDKPVKKSADSADSDDKNPENQTKKKKIPLDPDVESAKSLFESGDFKGAVEILSSKVETLGRLGFYYLGRSYSKLGQHEAALNTYKLLLGKNDKDGEFKALIGQELEFLGRRKEAKVALRDALELNPKAQVAYQELIKIFEVEKNKTDTRILYMDMVKYFGEKPAYITQLCKLTYNEALFDSSLKYCTRGLELSPNDPTNHVYLALTNRIKGDAQKAMKSLKAASEKFPQSLLTQVEFAKASEKSGNYIEAYQAYKNAAEISATEENRLGVASSAFEIQKFDEALKIYEELCLKNRQVWPYLRRSISYLDKNKMNDLSKKFNIALEKCGN